MFAIILTNAPRFIIRLRMVAEAEAPGRARQRTANKQISLITRAKARNLYVIQMLPAREVAAECGLTDMQVYKLAQHHKWAALRKERLAKLSEPLQAREKEQAEEVAIAAASLSDQGLLGSLMRANKAAESHHEFASKDCQAFASAARSLMQIGRTLRGLDGDKGAKGGGDTTNIIFVGPLATATSQAKREPVNVTPPPQSGAKTDAIDVSVNP